MTERIINIDELEFENHQEGASFEARFAFLSKRLGASKLGCNVTVVPAGKKAWPFHAHHENDELFFVLAGRGIVRIGTESFDIRPGDVICAPAGGEETAHQIINNSDADLEYLAISTMNAPDVMEYPDSGKFGVFAGEPPGGDQARRTFSYFGYLKDEVDYWKDE